VTNEIKGHGNYIGHGAGILPEALRKTMRISVKIVRFLLRKDVKGGKHCLI
jgi:hypothetical protein